jgi:hypothetical protein
LKLQSVELRSTSAFLANPSRANSRTPVILSSRGKSVELTPTELAGHLAAALSLLGYRGYDCDHDDREKNSELSCRSNLFILC